MIAGFCYAMLNKEMMLYMRQITTIHRIIAYTIKNSSFFESATLP